MATPCTSDTCSIISDASAGVLSLEARLKPDGGLECSGDGTSPNDGIRIHRFLDAENPVIPVGTANATKDCVIPLQVTDDGQAFSYIPPVMARAFPQGVRVTIPGGGVESDPSVEIEWTNETNCEQLVDFRCTQPQIAVQTLAGAGTATEFEGFIRLNSNIANINGTTDIFQRNDKTWQSPGSGNLVLWYSLIAGVYMVGAGQTLELSITAHATSLDNLDADEANDRGLICNGNHMIIYPSGLDVTP